MGPSDFFVSRATGIVLLTAAFCFCASQAARADDCLAHPTRARTAGGHWYYRVDHSTHRKCWYLKGAEAPSAATGLKLGGAAPAAADARSGAVSPEGLAAQAGGQPGLLGLLSSMIGGGAQPPAPPDAADDSDMNQPAPALRPRQAARARRPHPAKIVSRQTESESAQSDTDSGKADPPLDEAQRAALFKDFLRWRRQKLIEPHAADNAGN